MGLRDIGDTLPPGFRFYPSDEELVCHYLYKKIANEEVLRGTLVEIDLHICEPWQLPEVAKLNSNEWYFFSFRDRKYATGFRTNRATVSGYWKATGKDRTVLDPTTRAVVGMRKTLVFYKNRAPNGVKTGWIMHEFRLENPNVPPKEDWVLCRVFHKSRGENDDKLNFTAHNSAASPPTSNNANPTPHSIITSYYYNNSHPSHHHQGQNPSTSLGLSALVDPTAYLPALSHRDEDTHGPHNLSASSHNKLMSETTNAKCEDDYGFLFDFEGSNGVDDPMAFEEEDGAGFM